MLTSLPQSIKSLFSLISYPEFFRDMLTFIKHPEIYNGEDEYVPLHTCLSNFAKSIVISGLLVSLISILLEKEVPMANIFTLFNKTNYYKIYLLQAGAMGAAITVLCTLLTYGREKKVTPVFFYQVIQAYSVLNIPIIILLYLYINMIFLKSIGIDYIALDSSIFILSISVLYMIYRLIINPIRQCLKKYYHSGTTWVMIVIIFYSSHFMVRHLPSFSENNGLTSDGFCNIYAETYEFSPQIASQSKTALIQQCKRVEANLNNAGVNKL